MPSPPGTVDLAPRPELPPPPSRAAAAGPGPQSTAALLGMGAAGQQGSLTAEPPSSAGGSKRLLEGGESPAPDSSAPPQKRPPSRGPRSKLASPGELQFSPGSGVGGGGGRGASAEGGADMAFPCTHPGCLKARREPSAPSCCSPLLLCHHDFSTRLSRAEKSPA